MSMQIPNDAFTVNSFMFCAKHGGEACNDCGADYRIGNNYQVDRARINAGAPNGYVLDNRVALRAFYQGAIYTGRQRERYGIFQCQEHRVDDCADCFNWTNILIEQSHQKDLEGKIYDRNDLLGLLKSMGVELPANKLPEDALDLKLGKALTMSQRLTSVIVNPPLNPSDIPMWTANGVAQAMGRTSPAEAMRRFSSTVDPFPLYTNTWMDLRQTTMHLAGNFANGMKVMVLQDAEDHNEAICIRVLSVHKLDDKTPLVALLYCSSDLTTPATKSMDWFGAQMRTGRLGNITCTPPEQALFRKLLFQNSKRVSKDFRPHMESYERNFRTSFVVPLNPLSQIDVGKLVHNTGCRICGGNGGRRCSQCQSALYCSSVCQTEDWKNHKALCKSLQGASWTPVTFSKHLIVDGQKVFLHSISMSGTFERPTAAQLQAEHDDDSPPPDIHSEQPFLVKIQIKPDTQKLVVYDRQRSFNAYVSIDGPLRQIAQMDKVYRWAKRTGEWTLAICLDRNPEPEPAW